MLKTIKNKLIALVAVGMSLPAVCFAQVTITAEEDVPYSQVKVAQDTIDLMQTAVENEYGLTLDMDVDVHLHNKDNGKEQDKTTGNASPGKINIWLKQSDNAYKTCFLVAHELTHQYQIEQVGKDTLNKNMWFTEGMADMVGVQVANAYDQSKFRAFARSAASKVRNAGVQLSWFERRKAWNDAYQNGTPVYAKADLAMIYLTSKYPSMLMWSYLYNLKDDSTTASGALQRTYGITAEELDEILG